MAKVVFETVGSRWLLALCLWATACGGTGSGSSGADMAGTDDHLAVDSPTDGTTGPDDDSGGSEDSGDAAASGDAVFDLTGPDSDFADFRADLAGDGLPGDGAASDDAVDPGDGLSELGDQGPGTDEGDGMADQDAGPDAEVESGCRPRVLAAGQTRAKYLECPAEFVGGPMSDSRVGDVLLENARVRFVIRSGSAGSVLPGTTGGTLVDADLVRPDGVGRDQLRELAPVFALGVLSDPQVWVAAAGGLEQEAVVAVHGTLHLHDFVAQFLPLPVPAADVRREYRLSPDSDVLTIRTVVAPLLPGAVVSGACGAMLFVGGRVDWFWQGPGFDTDEQSFQGGFFTSRGPGVSYAVAMPAGVHFSMIEVAGLTAVVAQTLRTVGGQQAMAEQYFVVGDGSESALTERCQLIGGLTVGTVLGSVAPAPQGDEAWRPWVEARTTAGKVLSNAPLADDGTFRLVLEPGDVQLVVGGQGRLEAQPVPVTVLAGQTVAMDPLPLTVPTLLTATVSEAGTGRALPARITMVDLDHPEADTQYLLVAPGSEPTAVRPGRYRATVSRGPEYEAVVMEPFEMLPATSLPLTAVLAHLVDTTGWLAADTHLHDEFSTDTIVPIDQRVLACAAEGVEIEFATNHDFIAEIEPWPARLGLSDFVMTIPGVEMSSEFTGHMNAFPLVADRDQVGAGAPLYFGLDPLQVEQEIHARHPEALIQINHGMDDLMLFARMGFDPATGVFGGDSTDAGFDIQAVLDQFPFDIVEVFNSDVHETLAAWFALLEYGHRPTATGSSDSHDIGAFCGSARTYLYVGTDNPAAIDQAAVVVALSAQRVMVSGGPFVSAGLIDPLSDGPSLPGTTVTDTSGSVTLSVRVQSPTYLGLRRVQIVERGTPVIEQTFDSLLQPEAPVQVFAQDFELPTAADTWFVVIAEAAASAWPVTRKEPFAFTNPLYLDADGDGQCRPAARR